MAMRRSYWYDLTGVSPNVGDQIYDQSGLGYLYFGYGSANVQPPLLVNNIDAALDVVYVSWTGNYRYPSAGVYTAYWQAAARILNLNNNKELDYRVWATVNLTQGEISRTVPVNNSPVSSILPIIPVPQGVIGFQYQIDSVDINGDTRTFRMATPTEQGAAASTHPNGLSVSSTGLVTIGANLAIGYWSTQQVIRDSFGNVVMVDYMLDVQLPKSYCNTTGGCAAPCLTSNDCAQCGSAQSACVNALPRFVVNDLSSGLTPRTNRPTPARGAVFTMLPGQSLTLNYTADDVNLYRTATPVQIQFAGLPTTMTRSAQTTCNAASSCSYVGPYADPQTVSLLFNPTRNDAGTYVVCASAKSMANSLPYAQHCITVVVSNITDVCGDFIVGITEACDGGACCASDCKSFKPSGVTCGVASDVCESPASCTGFSASCPANPFVAPGTVCRAATGFCDVAEVCTGNSRSCPANVFKSSSVVCRTSTGTCDAAETCDGAGNCPADSAAAAGGVCRAAAGICDVPETCDGVSTSCPADTYAPSSQVCRAANDICDVAETCSGSGVSCPADSFAAASTVCRPSTGPCDVEDTCNGAGACNGDAASPAGTLCRAQNGPCDVAETCDGVSTSCGTDGFASSSVECRASAGECDPAEFCTGASQSCPADDLIAAGTTCRSAAGPCDVAETCTGNAACPADSFVLGGVCRAANGDCDVAESCDGTSASCPANAFAASSLECRASGGACDAAEFCSGVDGACPADAVASSSTICRPASVHCDVAEFCDGVTTVCPPNGFNTSSVCSTPEAFCTRNSDVGEMNSMNYFCTDNGRAFMQCVHGTGLFAVKLNCAAGTACGCPEGVECTCSGLRSPCTIGLPEPCPGSV
eukprot:TRINITY_DN4071_c0_g2_i2.p1 TRINITY_DN4071_c0_g2~~TRINITY_DN4071_c0_g2_i2.p1  ORF type:complete len:939 (+),score=163.11 TRINITY_DN4071_c0_g2_i2:201-2819(+)